MTKADLIDDIAKKSGIEKLIVSEVVEGFMRSVQNNMSKGESIYLRGFGSFLVTKRAEKTGRNISKNTVIVIPEHFVPTFKACKEFKEKLRDLKASFLK